MKFKIVILIFTLISTINSFGQIKSYDAILDSSSKYRIGDEILFEANLFKAKYFYNQLNYLDSISKLNLPIEETNKSGLHFCLKSKDEKYVILFYFVMLDTSKLTKYYYAFLNEYRYVYKYRYGEAEFPCDQAAFYKCFIYSVFGERNGKGAEWHFIEAYSYFTNSINIKLIEDIEEVKSTQVTIFLAGNTYFPPIRGNNDGNYNIENPEFWVNIKNKYLNKSR